MWPPPGQWGRLCSIGARADARGHVRLLEQVWWPHAAEATPTIWALPESTRERATSLLYHYSGDVTLVAGRPLAYMRYADVSARDAPAWSHPNNVARRAGAPIGLVPDPSGADEEDEGGAWNGEDWVVDIALCMKGHFALIKVVDKESGVGSVQVYAIKSVDKEAQTFKGILWVCSKSMADAACLKAAWHVLAGAKAVEVQADTVIAYFTKFNVGGKLPKAAANAAGERRIFEANPAGADPSPGDAPAGEPDSE